MNFFANWFSRIIIEARHIEYTIFSSLNGSNFYLKLMSCCQQNFKVTMLFFEEKKQLVGQKILFSFKTIFEVLNIYQVRAGCPYKMLPGGYISTYPYFEIFDHSFPLVTHFIKQVYEEMSPFGRFTLPSKWVTSFMDGPLCNTTLQKM